MKGTRSDWKRIRQVFLQRRPAYDASEVPDLLGIDASAVRQAIDQRMVAAVAAGAGLQISWEDVVALGLEQRWTLRMLTEALRGFRDSGLPPLLRVTQGRVVLPRYQWQVLRVLAERQARGERRAITVSDLLEEAVSTAVLAHIDDWQLLEAALPGVQAAASWPSAE